jgi:hypothetical protein
MGIIGKGFNILSLRLLQLENISMEGDNISTDGDKYLLIRFGHGSSKESAG